MKFTDEQINYLRKLYKRKKFFTVKGINQYGEEFEANCRIYRMKDEIDETGRSLFLQYDKKNYRTHAVEFSTEEFNYAYPFVILELIDKKGNKFYENQDKPQIVKETKKRNIERLMEQVVNGSEILEDDPVTSELRKMIGQPIKITEDGRNRNYEGRIYNRGILSSIDGVNTNGDIKITYYEDGFDSNLTIGKDAGLEKLIKGYKSKVIVENFKFDLDDIWEKRVKRIKIVEKINKSVEQKVDKANNEKITKTKVVKTTVEEKDKEQKVKDDWWQEK